MINALTQSFVGSTATNVSQLNKESKTNETQKTENERLSKLADQIKKGEYKLDMNATAQAISDSLL
ncbi:hypothetical protein DMB95_07775 [Campylobacter sp. MIT 12-8780]|uniref:flagellar biosynthesis anti-sigma factor FlgM n=1 Tax=unclassified Campylobacter TaxID=2593542 RepID=UPI0010F58A46|nr:MULTISPECIES: flagellar biosynthesis anti-sigma factor FlgM [unclassified Campylobacter]NDJ28020.1 flagellar biosynthesis anti-sigma factor FlgM [Campylobacter sp. MIT 19-121]TKX28210.1 hypothetical protein CQA38_08705 [Campylobacter sp. MIT 12-5580]TQR40510.1 hypothetical protein DMB95_07775 [Campylobacter sp. MIT 12-8780]